MGDLSINLFTNKLINKDDYTYTKSLTSKQCSCIMRLLCYYSFNVGDNYDKDYDSLFIKLLKFEYNYIIHQGKLIYFYFFLIFSFNLYLYLYLFLLFKLSFILFIIEIVVDSKLISLGKLDTLVITGLLTSLISINMSLLISINSDVTRNNNDITSNQSNSNDINIIEIVRMLVSIAITTGRNQKSLSINGILILENYSILFLLFNYFLFIIYYIDKSSIFRCFITSFSICIACKELYLAIQDRGLFISHSYSLLDKEIDSIMTDITQSCLSLIKLSYSIFLTIVIDNDAKFNFIGIFLFISIIISKNI